MASKELTTEVREQSAGPLTRAALDNLAARCHAGGQFLIVLDAHGALTYTDNSAAPFFSEFVLPLFQPACVSLVSRHNLLKSAAGGITATSPVTAWSFLPGVMASVFPVTERRAVQGVVVLAARSNTFVSSGEARQVYEQLGLDADWADRQIASLPGYDETSIVAAGQMLLGSARDQSRLGNLEKELDSLSTQLANSYEELSLIYQVSSGMKVNRTAGEFFRQACLDVRDVMNVRAMGVVLCGEGSCRQAPALYGNSDLSGERLAKLADQMMTVLRERKSPLIVTP